MRHLQLAVILLACAFTTTAHAGFYRCVDANGKFNFRDQPCPPTSRPATRADHAGPGGTFSSVGQSDAMRQLGQMEAQAAQRQSQPTPQDARLARKQAQLDRMRASAAAPEQSKPAAPKKYTPDGQHEIVTVTRGELPALLDEAQAKGRNRRVDSRSIETGLGTYNQQADGSYRGPGGERCARTVDSMACGTYFVPLK